MTDVRGFITVCCIGDYRDVARELLVDILDSRLYERSASIDLAVLGELEGQEAIDELIRPFDRFRVSYRSGSIEEYEFPALGLLQDACRDWSGSVYYLHTKGVSWGETNQHARYWRRLMLDHVVLDHVACLAALDDHDAVGTNWRGNHYSGNYWWARAEHIRRLPDIRSLQRAPRAITSDRAWNMRLQCELWISMANGAFANLGISELDLYKTIRWTADASVVMNDLLSANGGSRLLELVSEHPSPYGPSVGAQLRRVVALGSSSAPDPGALESAAAGGPYDVVFVDCWHEAEHALSAIESSLPMLAPGGAIVVHDTNPPTAWHQRPGSEFAPGSEWTGDVWRAIVAFRRAHPTMDVRTVDTDWGCTVIRPDVRGRDPAPSDPGELGWPQLAANRDELLGIVSLRRFRRDLFATPIRLGRRPLTSRTDLINCLISEFGLERYLEIGVADGANFAAVIAPIRQGVDPAGGATFTMTSDAFFAERLGCDRYDLIFIDALHEDEQCLRDLEQGLSRLSAGGFLVVHDANPPTEWHQRPASEVRPGEAWNGTVWKAIVRFRALHPDLPMLTVDLDWGCTVIRARDDGDGDAEAPEGVTPLDWAMFEANRTALLNLVEPNWTTVVELITAP